VSDILKFGDASKFPAEDTAPPAGDVASPSEMHVHPHSHPHLSQETLHIEIAGDVALLVFSLFDFILK
jgi:hypothetical protein